MGSIQALFQWSVVESIGWALVHSTWQIALVAAIYAVGRFGLRNHSASLRYGLACIALGTMVVVVAATVCIVGLAQPASIADVEKTSTGQTIAQPVGGPIETVAAPKRAASPEHWVARPERSDGRGESPLNAATPFVPQSVPPGLRLVEAVDGGLPWLVAGWLLGVVAFSARLACGWLGMCRLRRRGTSPVADSLQEKLTRLTSRLGMRRVVTLVQSTLLEVPAVIGHLRPVILLPVSLLTGLSPAQIDVLLIHELAHIRRHDYLINLVQTAVETLLFYHPAVWWVSREIRQERENCCDDLVLSVCGDRAGYARALASMETLRSGTYQPAVAASGGTLLIRIRRIVGRHSEGPSRRHAWLAGVVLLGVILATTIGIMGAACGASDRRHSAVEAKGEVTAERPEAAGDGFTLLRPAKPGWGKDVAGVQVGLRPDRKKWTLGETITWKIDARNRSKKRWIFAAKRVRVDGRELRPTRVDSTPIPVHYLEPSGQLRIAFRISRDWQFDDEPRHLVPGKHHVTMTCTFRHAGQERNRIQMTSNPVEIEIVAEPPKPEPATLVIHYNMVGDDPTGRFWLQLRTRKGDGWRIHQPHDLITVQNGVVRTIIGLRPGIYDLARQKTVKPLDQRMNVSEMTFPCDRRDVELKPGQQTKADFVRGEDAKAIIGRVTGLPDGSPFMLNVAVRPASVTGDPHSWEEGILPNYDVVSGWPGKPFTTARVPPDEYTLVAKALGPLTQDALTAGKPLPDFLGTAKVIVPAEGKVAEVEIKMLPRKEFEKRLKAAESGWGKRVDGVQVCLRPDRKKWTLGETITWKIDARNQGKRGWEFTPHAYEQVKINVDGREFRLPGARGTVRSYDLKPGGRLRDIPFQVSRRWKLENHPFELKPGRHRVTMTFTFWPEGKPAERIEVTSNTVDIEIVGKDRRGKSVTPRAEKPASNAKPSHRTHKSRASIRGQVVDAETGEPIEDFVVQNRLPMGPDYKGPVLWGGETWTVGGFPGGRFRIPGECRVVAPGYLPAHVKVPNDHPADRIFLIRLSRGETVRGRVLDHRGKPVAGAGIYLAGPRVIELDQERAGGSQAASVHTDAQGLFEISGRGKDSKAIFVSGPGMFVWRARLPESGQQATIRLPEPARLHIRYDIDGAPSIAQVRIELRTWEMPKWKRLVNAVRRVEVTPGQDGLRVDNLPPGVYDISRMKRVRAGDMGKGVMLNRTLKLPLESGKTTAYDFVRTGGTPIKGKVTGLPESADNGVFVTVYDPRVSGSPHSRDDWKRTTFDGLALEGNGPFTTERMEPGQYKVIAEAYAAETPGQGMRSGIRAPTWLGAAKVTVPAEGNPPEVEIKMLLREEFEKDLKKATSG